MSDLELLLELLEQDEFGEIPEIFKSTDSKTRGEFMEILNSRFQELEEEPVN